MEDLTEKNLTMEEFIKICEQIKNWHIGPCKICFVGASGAGKTTTVGEMLAPFPRKFIYSNIGAVQSSKILMKIIPVRMKNSENMCLNIVFQKNSELLLSTCKKVMCSHLVSAYRSFKEEDAVSIVEKFLKPDHSMYDISGYNNKSINKQLVNCVKIMAEEIIKGKDGNLSLSEKMEQQKKRTEAKGEKFNIKETVKKEIEYRVSNLDYETLKNTVNLFVNGMEEKIKDTVREYKNRQEKEEEKLVIDEDENKSIISVYINRKNGKAANELFQYLFEKDGKDIVIANLEVYGAMKGDMVESFSKKNINMPKFEIYDLKGLEDGENSIDETILKLRRCMPDVIFAYQRTNDISSYFMQCIDKLHEEFRNVPVDTILTHADTTLKSYIRQRENEYDAKSQDDFETEEEYNKYRKELVEEEYKQLEADNGKYNKKGEIILCSMVNESKELDDILGKEKALYNPQKIRDLIVDRYKQYNDQWKTINVGETDKEKYKKNIVFSFNNTKLKTIVDVVTSGHNNNAEREYYSQRTKIPHWNTVYKWRDCHAVGSGWASSAKVYDNISIYISNVISGFLKRDDIVSAIEISFSDKFEKEQKDYLGEAEWNKTKADIEGEIRENIEKDMRLYNGFFYSVKLWITYLGLKNEFTGTYYSDALKLIYFKLNSTTYVEEAMEAALKEFSKIYIARSFT